MHLSPRLLRRVIWRLGRALLLFQSDKAAMDSCCPICSHAMRPKDSPGKFMLFVCSSCGHEKQLDFEFSWRETLVNGIRVLAQVKHQRNTTNCIFYAIAAALEAMMKFKMAEKGDNYHDTISIDDMLSYVAHCAREDPLCGNHKSGTFKFTCCENMLKTIGVLTNKGMQKPVDLREDSDYVKIKESHWHDDMAFEETCSLVLQGKMLIATVRDTEAFHSLKPDDVYECTAFPETTSGLKVWHALVIVGFGVKDGKKFFRVQNSHGSYWADSGFGRVRDNSVGKIWELRI